MNPTRLTIIGGSLIVIVVIALGWVVGISPKLDEAAVTIMEQDAAEAVNVGLESELAVMQAKFANTDELAASYAALQTQIPGAVNGPDFIDQVKAIADANGVVVSGVTLAEGEVYEPLDAAPAPAVTPTPTPTASSPAAAAPAPTSGLTGKVFTVAFSISVLGTNEQVLNFTNALQEGTRIVIADQVNFTGSEGTSTGTIAGFILVVTTPPATAVPAG